jgi:hypothetical protein
MVLGKWSSARPQSYNPTLLLYYCTCFVQLYYSTKEVVDLQHILHVPALDIQQRSYIVVVDVVDDVNVNVNVNVNDKVGGDDDQRCPKSSGNRSIFPQPTPRYIT